MCSHGIPIFCLVCFAKSPCDSSGTPMHSGFPGVTPVAPTATQGYYQIIMSIRSTRSIIFPEISYETSIQPGLTLCDNLLQPCTPPFRV